MTTGRPAWSSSLPLTGDIVFEGHRFELRGGHQTIPDRHYLWQAEERAIVGGVLRLQRRARLDRRHRHPGAARRLDRRARRDGGARRRNSSCPATACPDAPADVSAIRYTRDYLNAFEEILASAPDGAAATEALVKRYPDAGMLIAAQIGPKVAKGEMTWG